MNINIRLGGASFVYLGEVVSLPLAEGERVTVTFSSSDYRLGALVLLARCGDVEKKYKTVGEPIDITELCSRAGAIEMSVGLVIKGKTAKTWAVETLVLKEAELSLVPIPELVEMRKSIETMKKALLEMKVLVENSTKM